MRRALHCLALAGVVLLGACRPGTVRLQPTSEVGDVATYRYEIVATITSVLDGNRPSTTAIDTTLVVDQRVTGQRPDGAEAEVRLRRDGGPAQRARVVLDPTGALRAVDAISGLDGVEGLPALDALLAPPSLPPRRPLAPGSRWRIDEGPLRGNGRVERLAVEDGAKVMSLRTRVGQAIDEDVSSGASTASLLGALRSDTTATYVLGDGALRRSTTQSTGEVRVRIEPPDGVDAQAALGTITFDLRVRTTRLR